ncbi:MAG: phage minor capsid protein [Blautia faecis]
MTASGLRYIEYDSGHRDRIDVAARRAILTGFRQVQGKIMEMLANQLGTDLYEVSYHVGARPTHQPWQGKAWSMQELKQVCGLGEITGLKGINCYHDFKPIPPGAKRTYTDEQLQKMLEEENTQKEYNGKQYTTYEALQQQRKMERGMRAQRQKIKLLQQGGADEQEIILAKAKYQGQMQTYKDFSEKMKLPEQKARIMQDGLKGKFMPTKAEQKVLEESAINDKIKADMKAVGMRGEINLKPEIPDVSKLSFDEHHINQERQHNVTESEAKSYIQKAVFSTTKWKGKFTNYYSDEGAAFVDNETQHIKTAFKKEQYDEAATAAMEVLKNGWS